VEVIMLVLCIAVVIVFFCRFAEIEKADALLKSSTSNYINMQQAAALDEARRRRQVARLVD